VTYKSSITVRVEGIDAADSSEAAMALREDLLRTAVERNIPGVEVRMSRSDPDAQDVGGDVLNIFHTGVLTGLLVVESVKLWREIRRDKAIIVEAKQGNAVRVEMSDPNAPDAVEKAALPPSST
jgi:hypothetical protein